MSTLSTHRTLHPMQWLAAASVTLLCLTGVAAITGLIPTSKSNESTAIPQPVSAASAPVVDGAAKMAQTAQQAPVKRSVPVQQRRHERIARAEAVAEPASPPPPPAVCRDCGRIESVQRIVHEGAGSGAGAVAGGVVGGALANNVGRGSGKALATIAGAIGGAMLGNHIEKSRNQSVSWQTTVRFDDGSTRVFNSSYEQGLREGERVRLVNGSIQPE